MTSPDVRKPTSPAAWWVTPGFRPMNRVPDRSATEEHTVRAASPRRRPRRSPRSSCDCK